MCIVYFILNKAIFSFVEGTFKVAVVQLWSIWFNFHNVILQHMKKRFSKVLRFYFFHKNVLNVFILSTFFYFGVIKIFICYLFMYRANIHLSICNIVTFCIDWATVLKFSWTLNHTAMYDIVFINGFSADPNNFADNVFMQHF